jgi:tripeptidyl-peptidase-1
MQNSTSCLKFGGLLLLVTSSLANPVITHIQHEKRSPTPESPWERKSQVQADVIIPLRIGLVQTNLEKGYEHLLSISNPGSPRYGQHFSMDEVHSLFAPTRDTVDAVLSWLLSSGIEGDDIVHSDNKGWLALDVPSSSAEQLLRTTIHEYEHRDSGALRLGCEEYHLPSHLVKHIDYITPGVKLSALVKKRTAHRDRRAKQPQLSHLQARSSAELTAAQASLPPDLRHCHTNITTQCIRALYDIPVATLCDPANAPGFFEQGDYYSQEDLNIFFEKVAPWVPNGTEPTLALIDGAKDPYPPHSKLVTGEADGDIEISFGLVYPTVPIVYQVDDQRYATHEVQLLNLFNTFLDAVGSSTLALKIRNGIPCVDEILARWLVLQLHRLRHYRRQLERSKVP